MKTFHIFLVLIVVGAFSGWARTYTTNFPLTESPISEGGNWINGATDGKDWGDVSTTPGKTHPHTGPTKYADPTALLTGTWGPNQTVEATVYVNTTYNWPEVELRLRMTMHANWCSGYEVLYSLSPNAYGGIVRWNGPLGLVLSDFTFVKDMGPECQVKAGDVVKATIIGNVITVYKNGVQLAQATDNTYATGNPGMGFDGMDNGDYGFTKYSATDGSTSTEGEMPAVRESRQPMNRHLTISTSSHAGVYVRVPRATETRGDHPGFYDLSGHEVTSRVSGLR